MVKLPSSYLQLKFTLSSQVKQFLLLLLRQSTLIASVLLLKMLIFLVMVTEKQQKSSRRMIPGLLRLLSAECRQNTPTSLSLEIMQHCRSMVVQQHVFVIPEIISWTPLSKISSMVATTTPQLLLEDISQQMVLLTSLKRNCYKHSMLGVKQENFVSMLSQQQTQI